jgi:hypothetical protein
VFPLAVAEAHNLPQEVLIELLGRRRLRLLSELETLKTGYVDVTTKHVPQKFWLDITYQEAMVNAEIAWLDGLVSNLRSGQLDWSAAVTKKGSSHDNHN